jgi:hypothetical protein
MLYVDQAGVRVSSGAKEKHERSRQRRGAHLLATDNVTFEDRLEGKGESLVGVFT